MKVSVTYDANGDAGLDDVISNLNAGLANHLRDRFYDDSGIEIFIILMCRDPRWNFKQRIRFVKKENTLYMDIMLDLNVMSHVDTRTRKTIVGDKIVNEIPQIVAKYKFKDFDLPRFSSDLREWFEDNGWIDADSREPKGN